MSEKMRTPILDALESLSAAAGMCGFHASDMAILSNDLFDRVVVELTYRGEIARSRQMAGPNGAAFLALDFPYVRIYRPATNQELERAVGPT